MNQKLLQLIIQLRDEASAGLSKLQGSMGALQVAAGNLLSSGIQAAGEAIIGIGTSSISAAGDFEAGMNSFKVAAGDSLAAAGLTVDDFKNKFLEIGAELPVSTAAVQEAATTLVKGGLDPLVVSMGGLESSIKFATAAGMGLNEAAELSIKQLGTFVPITATAAEQTEFLANAQDLLVKAAGASTLDVDKLGAAMLAAGGQAKTSGVEYQDFVTTMGLISPMFDSAATAGTSYKNFLARLQPTTDSAKEAFQNLGLTFTNTNKIADFLSQQGIKPLGDDIDTLGNQFTEWATSQGWTVKQISKAWDGFSQSKFFDMDGQFVGNAESAELLKQSLAGLSDAERSAALQAMFGNDAMGAAAALAANGSEGYNKFADAMGKATGVQATAATMQEGFNIALDNFGGSLEALQITVGSAVIPVLTELFNNVISPAVNTITAFASAIASSADPWQTFIDGLNNAIPGLGSVVNFVSNNFMPILAAVGAMILAVVVPALYTWAIAAGTAAVATIAAMWPVYAIIAGIGLAVGLLVAAWTNNWFGIQGAVAAVWGFLQPIFAQIGAWLSVNIPIALAAVVAAFWVIVGAVQTAGSAIQTAFGAAVVWLQATWTWITTSAATAWASITAGASAAGLSIQTAFGTTVAWFAAAWAWIQASAAMAWAAITLSVNTVVVAIQTAFGAAVAWLAAAWASIVGVASAAWATVSTVVGGAIAAVVGVIQTGMGIINTIMLAVGNTVLFLGSWAFQGLLNLISPVIAAIVAVVGPPIEFMVGNLVGNFLWALGIATMVWTAISSAVSTAATTIVAGLTAAGAVIGGALSSAWAAISTGASSAWAAITGAVNSGVAAVTGAATSAGAVISGALSSAWAAISTGASSAWAAITGTVSSGAAAVTGAATSAGASISGALSSAWAAISTGASSAWAAITGAISAGIALLVSMFATGWANMQANATSVWTQIKAAVDTAITGIKTVIQSGIDIVKTIITTAWSVIVAASENDFGSIPGIIDGAWTEIKGIFSTGVEEIKKTFGGVVADMKSIGGDIVGGIQDGISGAWGRFEKWIGDQVAKIPAPIRTALGIGSPSRVIAALVGLPIAQGIMLGFSQGMPKVTTNLVNGVSGLMDKIANAVDKGSQALNAVSSFQGSSGTGLAGFLAGIKDLAIQFNDLAVSLGGRILGTATRFAETVGKVTGVLEAGVKGLNALADLVAPSRESVAQFGNAVALVVGNLATVAGWFEAKAIKAAAVFAEGVGKILALIGPAIEALKKLPELVVPSREAVAQFGDSLALIVGNLAEITTWFDAKSVTATAVFAESVGKIVAMIGPAVDAFAKLPELISPTRDAVMTLWQGIVMVVSGLLSAAQLIGVDALAAVATFAEGAGKVLAILKTAVEGLTAVRDLGPVGYEAIGAFAGAVDQVVVGMAQVADDLGVAAVESAATFAVGAGKVLAILKTAVEGLTAVRDLGPVGYEAIGAFAGAVDQVIVYMAQVADDVGSAAVDAAAQFAAGAGTVLAILKTAVEGLAGVRDLGPVGYEAIASFAGAIDQVIVYMAQVADDVGSVAVEASAKFGEGVQKTVSGIGAAVDALSKLVEFVAPAQTNVSAFFLALADLLERMGSWAGNFEADMLAATATFAEGIQKSVAGIGAAADALGKLVEFVAPAQKNVSAFFLALADLLEKMGSWAGNFDADMLAVTGAFATAINQSVAPLKGAIESLGKFTDFVPPAQKGISAFFAALVVVLQQIGQVSAMFGAEAVASAVTFATNVATVVAQLKGALQAFASLGDIGVKPAVLNAFMQAAQSLLAQVDAYLPPNAEVIGTNTIIGLINGIVGQRSNLIAAMTNTVLAAVLAAEQTLGIASPSKVFAQMAEQSGAGFVGGAETMQPALAAAGQGLAMAATEGAANMMPRMSASSAQGAVMPVGGRASGSAALASTGGGGDGGGTSTITIERGAIVINQQPGENADALANKVLKLIEARLGLKGR